MMKCLGMSALFLAIFILASCQHSPRSIVHGSTGIRIGVPNGWGDGSQKDSHRDDYSPFVLTSDDSSRMLMLWMRPRQDSPSSEQDSRRLGLFAARYAAANGLSINKWSAPESFVIHDVCTPGPIRDARQVQIISADSAAVEACFYMFSYQKPVVPSAMREVAYGILRSLQMPDGSQPFRSLTDEVLRTSSIKTPLRAGAHDVDGQMITLPKNWIAEDLLLIGSPAGVYDKAADHASLSLMYTRGTPGQVPSVTLSWASEGCGNQSSCKLRASLQRFLDKARASGMRVSQVSGASSGESHLWRVDKEASDGERHMVHWVYVTDRIAFQARGLSRDKSSMLEQQKLVLGILDQLVRQ